MKTSQNLRRWILGKWQLSGFLVGAILFLNAASAFATNRYWNVSSGGWSTAANWGGTEPVLADWAYIQNGGTAIVTQPGETCTRLFLGYYSVTSGTVQITSGDLTIPDVAWIGLNGTGTINQSGGTSTCDSILLGSYAGSNGYYSLSGDSRLSAYIVDVGLGGNGTFTQKGGIHTVSDQLNLALQAGSVGNYDLSGTGQVSAKSENIGAYGTGTFTQTGGTNTITDTLDIGGQPGSVGNYNLSGTGQLTANEETIGAFGSGTFSQISGTNTIATTLSIGSYSTGLTGTYNLSGSGQVSAKNEYVGTSSNGAGEFLQSGGTNIISSVLSIGQSTGSLGSYTLSETGQIAAYSEIIGDKGNGTFTQTGGTNTITNGLFIGYSAGSSGTYNLNGGTLILKNIIKASGTAAFNFGGGTLRASGTFSTSLPMTLTSTGGDANIDTAGYNVTCSGILSGAGGLTKIGSGTLILSTANTFTGPVNFNGGLIKTAALNRLGNGTGLNFGGGALQFDAVFDPSTRVMTFLAGGATLDTQSYNITLANPIGNGGPGGLTKKGTGKLTLNAQNTYSGNTVVMGGTLEIANGIAPSGTSLIDVQSGKVILKTINVNKNDLDIHTGASTIFEILNGSHTVGDISGGGTIQVDSAAKLSATSIHQATLIIGSGLKVVSGSPYGAPLSGSITPVPEPSTFLLLVSPVLWLMYRRWPQLSQAR